MDLIKFNLTEKEIAERLEEPIEAIAILKDQYMALKVNSIDDKEGYSACHEARMDIKKRRVKVEKNGKATRAEATAYAKLVIKVEDTLVDMLKPIEDYLLSQEKIVDDEKDRIRREFEEARLKEEKEAKEAEEARLEKQRIDQENERKRLEVIAEEQRQKEVQIKAEQDAIAREKQRIIDEKQKAENDKLRADQFEKEKALAVEKAKREEADRIQREIEQKAEKERVAKLEEERKDALKPDKEKVIQYINGIMNYMANTCPAIKDKTVYTILVDLEAGIEKNCDASIKKVEVL